MPQLSGIPQRRRATSLGLRTGGLLALTAVLLAAGVALPTPRAEAQGVYGYWDAPPSYRNRKLKKAKRPPSAVSDEERKSSGKKGEDEAIAERPAQGPLVISVSLARQRLTVYDETGPIAVSPISSGRVGFGTPTGIYTIVQKKRMHFSNLYDSAPMPNMQRITWSGVALHAGALPGYPASHGCIRLPHGFSKKLFGMTKMGTRVIVSRDPVAPVPFEHARLFTAFPPEDDLASAPRETRVADASAASGSSDAAMSGMIGVSTAAAADNAQTTPATPVGYRERRRLEAEKLNAEIRSAGYDKAEKMILLTQAHKAAALTREPLMAARADAERLDDQLHELERALSSAERELAELKAPEEDTGKRKRKKAMDESKRVAKIVALDEKVSRLPSEIEATRSASQHANEVRQAAESVAKEAEDKRRAAMNDLMKANAALSQGLAKEQAAKKLAAMRNLPVSVFVSRAKQRLYIRQGYEDVLDVPVTFDRPDDPVGTHVFTALAVAENKTAMRWSVASIPYDPSRSVKKKKDKQAKAKATEPPSPAVDLASQTAAAALDRIAIPEDVREQIADVMKPGSSLVISDLAIGNETGEYTDFIVPLR